MYNEHNSLTSRHKITLDRLTYCYNQSKCFLDRCYYYALILSHGNPHLGGVYQNTSFERKFFLITQSHSFRNYILIFVVFTQMLLQCYYYAMILLDLNPHLDCVYQNF